MKSDDGTDRPIFAYTSREGRRRPASRAVGEGGRRPRTTTWARRTGGLIARWTGGLMRSQASRRPRPAWLLAMPLLAVPLLAAAGCAGSAEPSPPPSPRLAALIAPQTDGALAGAIRIGAEAAAKEFGYRLEYVDKTAGRPGAGQVEAAGRALKAGAEALLLDPDSEQQLDEVVRLARAAGAAVITLSDAYPVGGVASAVTIDNREAGRQAGAAMAELLGGYGRVAVLGADSSALGYAERQEGVLEELARHPDITIAKGYSCGMSSDGCAEAARQLMDETDGIVALQEQGVLSSAKESLRRGASSEVKIVGFGSETEQLELLQDGVIDRLVVQSGFNAGYLGMRQADLLLRGEKPEARITLATKAVSPDSMFWMDNQKLLFPFVK
ncbi:substrate-binding domain-containing protein [Paenibacillus albicereus]|uniref:Substrate-binding domain-containing protein n=1 Tax=Paenibacillus albicereus TaxID=2726185 RepID=A0A6H2GV94_9BACL|nr:substrate-binding domain-containing protein [Paenibacillus albicereus]QJC51315.1 substrate-binding domain-containing protein [Paenibacillus albicereus]